MNHSHIIQRPCAAYRWGCYCCCWQLDGWGIRAHTQCVVQSSSTTSTWKHISWLLFSASSFSHFIFKKSSYTVIVSFFASIHLARFVFVCVCVFVCLCFLSKSIHIFSRPTASHPPFNGLEQSQWGYVLPTVVTLCRPSTLDRQLLYCIVLVIFPLSVQLNVAVS